MNDPHTPSDFLLQIWREINDTCFSSTLAEPADIGWLNLSAEPDLNEDFGYFFSKQNGIALSHRFQYAEAQHALCEKIAKDPTMSREQKEIELLKFNAYEIVYRLVVHEMIHQASHQAGESATSHGLPFLKHAKKVAENLGIPEPTLADAPRWPSVIHFLELETQAGHVSA